MTKKKQMKKPNNKQIEKRVEMTPDERCRHNEMTEQKKRRFQFGEREDGKFDYLFEDEMSTERQNTLICETLGTKSFKSAHLMAMRLGNFGNRTGRDVDRMNEIVSMVADIEPRDNIEAMLASQMVTIHELMMECSTRARLVDQTFEGTKHNLNSAIKLSRVYVGLVDALNKHRGKGQQKMTVEHVTVNEGGQAVVGNINAGEAQQVLSENRGEKNNGE